MKVALLLSGNIGIVILLNVKVVCESDRGLRYCYVATSYDTMLH